MVLEHKVLFYAFQCRLLAVSLGDFSRNADNENGKGCREVFQENLNGDDWKSLLNEVARFGVLKKFEGEYF